jgi:hypothetical protein
MPESTRRNHTIFIILRWLKLILIGWLTYALVRALWTVIYLGAPLFDWQWYLAVIALLFYLSVRSVRHLPRSRLSICALVGLLIWIAVGYNGFGRGMQLWPAQVAPVPISFWTNSSINQAPETVLEDLYSSGGWLYLSIGKHEFDGENVQALIDGLRRLAEYDIEVFLAPRASNFLSVPVHDEWITNVRETVAIVQRQSLTNVRGIIGDAEQPLNVPLDLCGLDRNAFFQAMRDLDGLTRWMRNEHPDLSLGVTAVWSLYLDSIDGDSDLSIISRSSVDPPGNWDFINVMTYSSFVPPSWRAYYVYLVERTMARRYPDRQPSHLIGLVGGGASGGSLLDFDDLVRDARLSRAMGVREIVVFRLDGALKLFGNDFVRRLTAAVNDTPTDLTVGIPFSRPASMLIYGTVVADALLDARGWKGLLLIGWMVLSGLAVYHSSRQPSHEKNHHSPQRNAACQVTELSVTC